MTRPPPSIALLSITLVTLLHTAHSQHWDVSHHAYHPSAGRVLVNDECLVSNGSTHLLIQPTFPSSGRGWLMSLLYNTLKATGGGVAKQNLAKGFGAMAMNISTGESVEWLFTHSFDDETIIRAISATQFPQRPLMLMRVVRSPLNNVEAYYRYMKREEEKPGGHFVRPFNDFVSTAV